MLTNWFYIIPNIFFGILMFLAIKRSKKNIAQYGKNYLPLLIISLYFISASLIYFVKPAEWYPSFHSSSYTPLNFTIYSTLLFLFLYPSLYLQPLAKNIKLPNSKFISLIMILMILLGIFSFIYQFPYAIQGFLIGSVKLRLAMNLHGFSLLPKSPLTTLAVGVSFFYLFYIAFFFIAIIQKKSILFKAGLLLGSLSYIVSGITFATRDVFIFYGISFWFAYLYFSNLLSNQSKQKLRILLTLFGAILVFGLSLISYQRFNNNNSDNNMAIGTIGYIAQQPFVFSETVEMQTKYYYGHLRFPIFTSLINKQVSVKRTIPYEWSFGTFIKDFYSTGGYSFLLIATLILVLLFYYKVRKLYKEKIYRNMIFTLFYFQFMSMGVFYFKLGNKAGNIYIIILLIFYLMTYFKLGTKEVTYR